jgi:hypothetical protein
MYFFGGLECVGHSFAYFAHLWFLRELNVLCLDKRVSSPKRIQILACAAQLRMDILKNYFSQEFLISKLIYHLAFYVLVKVFPKMPLSILIWQQASFMRAKHF